MDLAAEFRVLGRLDVSFAGTAAPIAAGKQQILLAGLLLRANRFVAVDKLVEWLWGDNPPANPKAALQTYVLRLRQFLDSPDRVTSAPNGYQIIVRTEELDLLRFTDLVEWADRTNNRDQQVELLSQAHALWRGPVLSDVPSEALLRDELPPLVEKRLVALERLFDVKLALGHHAEVVGDIRAVAAEHPLRERFSAQLMIALHRSGRQAEALAVYRELGELLAGELGIDPGEQLRRLYHAVLVDDPELAPPQASERRPVPAELPADLDEVVGRSALIEQITPLLSPAPGGRGAPLVVLSGPPGVGKTSLAVHIGHRLRARFPDGQLYVNLRGFGPGEPLDPALALARLVAALGVPADQVPTEVDAVTAMYRTLMASRRMLVLLDNAATSQQVRPLLPGAPQCAVMVTSRHELRGLTALQCARRFNLDVLSEEHSVLLLGHVIGTERIRAEPAAAQEVARLCGYLPLALRVAAANLAGLDDYPLAEYTAELGRGNRLATLGVDGDEQATVRATFALSYRALPAEVASLFRLLGLIPGPTFNTHAVAALADLPRDRAAQLLSQLATANLVQRAGSRFQFHDLLRLYASEQAHLEDSEDYRTASLRRLVAYYLHGSGAAAELLYPGRLRLPDPPFDPAVPSLEFPDGEQALAWLDTERPNLVAAAVHAADHDPSPLTWCLADALRPYLTHCGHHAEGLAALDAGLKAALGRKDRAAEAAVRCGLARLHWGLGDYPRALEHLTEELAAHRETNSSDGVPRALIGLGRTYRSQGRLREAADHTEQALALARAAGHQSLQQAALLNLGSLYLDMGRLDHAHHCLSDSLVICQLDATRHLEISSIQMIGEVLLAKGVLDGAVDHLEQALDFHDQMRSRQDEAEVLSRLALAHRDAGRHDTALKLGNRALAIARDISDRQRQADALNALATTHEAVGDHEQAEQQHIKALELADAIGYQRAEMDALIGLAETRRSTGDLPGALSCGMSALTVATEGGFLLHEAAARTALARVHHEAGRHTKAIDDADAAVRVYVKAGSRSGEAHAQRVVELAQRALSQAVPPPTATPADEHITPKVL